MKVKDGVTYTEREIRSLHPRISFAASTYAELGYLDPPVLPPTLEEVKQRALTKVQAAKNLAEEQTVQFIGNTFAATAEARHRLLFVLTAYADNTLPAGYTWPDINDMEVAVNLGQLRGLSQVIAATGRTISSTARSRRNAIAAATTIAEVEAIEASV